MSFLLPALAVAFAAFCVWLTVRIVNRKERWAKWTLAAVVGLPVLYVASFGPACWMCDRDVLSERFVLWAYSPLAKATIDDYFPPSIYIWYGELFSPQYGLVPNSIWAPGALDPRRAITKLLEAEYDRRAER
ncbi:MAG: hypothetical protein HY290_13710 [Planctomycetia bacterium]|nr:hypothetical protein [Planctomycetia bacterium]